METKDEKKLWIFGFGHREHFAEGKYMNSYLHVVTRYVCHTILIAFSRYWLMSVLKKIFPRIFFLKQHRLFLNDGSILKHTRLLPSH